MSSASMATRASPSYGIKYISAFKHIKSASIKPITANKQAKDFEFLKYLSRGDSGSVYLARDTSTTKEYALKIMPKACTDDNTASNEQRIQHLVDRDGPSFLLPILASWHDSENFYIVTEYMWGRDMAVEIARCGSFDEDRVKFYGAEMILAVEELKSHRVIHRDIKPTNILIDAAGHIRLTNFGCAKKFDVPAGLEDLDNPDACLTFDADANCESGAFFKDIPNPVFKTSEVVGTLQYMSPQRIAGKEYGDQEDMWSVGVVLFLMFTGRMPFGDSDDPAAIAYCIKYNPLEFEKGDFLSDNAKSLLIGMLTKDTRTRLSMEQVKGHAFFKGIDWQRVKQHGYKAQWTPFLAPIPKKPMTQPPNLTGGVYEDRLNPLPSYMYTSLKMDDPKFRSVAVRMKRRSHSFKDLGFSMTKILRSGRKEEAVFVGPVQRSLSPQPDAIHSPVNTPLKRVHIQRTEPEREILEKAKAPAPTKAEVCVIKVPYAPMPAPRAMTDEEILKFKSKAKVSSVPGRLVTRFPENHAEGSSSPTRRLSIEYASMLIHESPVKGQTPAIFLQPSPSSGFVGDCAMVLADVPNAYSAQVEIWEDPQTCDSIRSAKLHLTIIEEEEEEESDQESLLGINLDEFPLPPGYASFEDRGSSPSPCTTLALSPTPTTYSPSTTIHSPTPTVVECLDPLYTPQASKCPNLFDASFKFTKGLQQDHKMHGPDGTLGEPDRKGEGATLKRAHCRNRYRFSWEGRELFSSLASRPSQLTDVEEDRYTPIPARRHRASIRERTLAGQAPIYDSLGPLQQLSPPSQPAGSPTQESILGVPFPTSCEEQEEKGGRELLGRKRRGSAVTSLIESIQDYLNKMFNIPPTTGDQYGSEYLQAGGMEMGWTQRSSTSTIPRAANQDIKLA